MNALYKKVLLAVVVVPLACTTVYAKGGGHRNNMNAMPLVKVLKQVDLTSEQKEQVETIIATYQPADRGALHDDMMAILKAEKFDAEKAQALIAAREAMREENKIKRLQMRHDVYQALTAEQQAKMELLLDMQEQKMSKRGKGKGQRKGDGQGWW